MTERPFIPRPPGEPAWWAREATAAELAAVERERRVAELAAVERQMSEREVLSGVRHGDARDD